MSEPAVERSTTAVAVPIEELFTHEERSALVGFLAGYAGQTRAAYTLDLRQYTSWCATHRLHLFEAKRADIECYARDLESSRPRPGHDRTPVVDGGRVLPVD